MLRPVELVAGDRQEVDAQRRDVERDLADASAPRRSGTARPGPGTARRSRRAAGSCRSRCDRHDRDERGVRTDHGGEPVEIDEPVGAHRQDVDGETFLGETSAALEHAFVLGRKGDDVVAAGIAALIAQEARGALDGEVVRLGGARRGRRSRAARRRSAPRPGRGVLDCRLGGAAEAWVECGLPKASVK